MFDSESFDAHEKVTFFSDKQTGVKGIIAIHSSALGPAMGGCRVWNYPNAASALADALRLSRGMSYKNAVAGLPLGGGKAVILRNGNEPLDDASFEAFGDVIQQLGGKYVTAEDVGVTVRNIVAVARRTSFVSGLPKDRSQDAVGGDPSPMTAFGVFLGIRSAVRHRFGRSDLSKLSIAVQGLGNVGRHLCKLLKEAGADLTVADVDPRAVEYARVTFGAKSVAAEEILFQPVDVVSPCALGAGLNETSIPKIRAHIVAGAANNQLQSERDGQHLFDADILYAPDYVINAGGIISVGLEYLGETDINEVTTRVERIEQTLDSIFQQSRATGTPPHHIADALARARLEGESVTRTSQAA